MAVYFVQDCSVENGPIKIGFTENLYKRITTLNQSLPYGVSELKVFPDWDYATEQALHKIFAPHRIRGEWYRPAKQIFDFISLPAGRLPISSWILKHFNPRKPQRPFCKCPNQIQAADWTETPQRIFCSNCERDIK